MTGLQARLEQAISEAMAPFGQGRPYIGPGAATAAIVAACGVLADELGHPGTPRRLPTEPGAVILVTEVRGVELDSPESAFLTTHGPTLPWFTPDAVDTGDDAFGGHWWHGPEHIQAWLPARLVRDDEQGPVAALEAVVRLLDGPQAEHAQEAQDVAKRALRELAGPVTFDARGGTP